MGVQARLRRRSQTNYYGHTSPSRLSTRKPTRRANRPYDWVPQGFGEGYVNAPFVYYDGELYLGRDGERHEKIIEDSPLPKETKELLKDVHMGRPELLPEGTRYFDGVIDYWWDEDENGDPVEVGDDGDDLFERAAIVYPWSMHGVSADEAKDVVRDFADRVYVVQGHGFTRLARRVRASEPVVYFEGETEMGGSFGELISRVTQRAVDLEMVFPEDEDWLNETLEGAHAGAPENRLRYFDGVLDGGVLKIYLDSVGDCGQFDFDQAAEDVGALRYELVKGVAATKAHRRRRAKAHSEVGFFEAYLDGGVLTVIGDTTVNCGDSEFDRWADYLGCRGYAVVYDLTRSEKKAAAKHLVAVPAAEAVGPETEVGGRVTVDSPPDEGRLGPFAYVDGEVYSDGAVHAEVLANAFPEEEADALTEVRFGRPGIGPKKDWAESVGFAAGHLYEDGALVEADSVRNASRAEVVQAVFDAFPVDTVYFTLGDCKNGGEYQVERVAAVYKRS